MTVDESEDAFASYLRMQQEFAEDKLVSTTDKNHKDMRRHLVSVSVDEDAEDMVMQPHLKRRMIQASSSSSSSSSPCQSLITTANLKSVATRAGLAFQNTQGIEEKAEESTHVKRQRLGQEYESRHHVPLNMAQVDTLVRLFAGVCQQQLSLRRGRGSYTIPQPGGVNANDPHHSCLNATENTCACNFIEVPAGASEDSGRLFYCTVTGVPHFCSRLTCDYFVRQPTRDYDCCALTGACFKPLPSSGMTYLAVQPHLRRTMRLQDDEDVDMEERKTRRKRRTEKSQEIRESVAVLRNDAIRKRVVEDVAREHNLQGTLTAQAAVEMQKRIEKHGSITAMQRVRCAVHTNVADKRLQEDRLDQFRSSAVLMFKRYHQCRYSEEDVRFIVNVCEKTWVTIVNSATFLKGSMSYPVVNHAFVIMSIASCERGYQVDLGKETIVIVPPCPLLIQEGHYTGEIYNTKKVLIKKLCNLRSRFKSYINELIVDQSKHQILFALKASYEKSGIAI
jgi:hypothetical protein